MEKGEKYSIIVMYTISDDTMRNSFRENLQKTLKVDFLNESTYGIRYSGFMGEECAALNKICKEVCIGGQEFKAKDFVSICYPCAAIPGDLNKDKVKVVNIVG